MVLSMPLSLSLLLFFLSLPLPTSPPLDFRKGLGVWGSLTSHIFMRPPLLLHPRANVHFLHAQFSASTHRRVARLLSFMDLLELLEPLREEDRITRPSDLRVLTPSDSQNIGCKKGAHPPPVPARGALV